MRLSYSKVNEHQWQQLFDKHLAELSDFLARFDKFPTQKEEPVLNNWLKAIMYEYKLKRLGKEYVDKLNAIGMLWNAKDIYWYERYKEVKKQLTESKQLIDKRTDKVLYTWLIKQLKLLKNKKIAEWQKNLITDLNTLLQQINPDIEIVYFKDKKTVQEEQWMRQFDKLKTFRLQYPDRWPTRNVKELDESKLVAWCTHQRNQYHRLTLPEVRLAKLKEIGFKFILK